MAAIQQVNENSSAYLSVEFRDQNDNLASPSTVTFDVECLTTQTAIRSSVAIAPATIIEIVLLPADNIIQNEVNPFEIKRVSVHANYGSGEAIHDQYEYRVRNMSKV